MGIFSRVRDIISANINSMLDRAEDPEKLVKLMIREMEDTMVEIKASCAGAMATRKKIERELAEVEARAAEWRGKAELAVQRGREDLAREALLEKRRYVERGESLERERDHAIALVEQYQSDIQQIEDKLGAAREKQRMLVQRHIHAQGKKRMEREIRRFNTEEALARFEQFESRVEHMEAEAELVNYGRKSGLREQFAALESDEEIENELRALKSGQTPPA